VFCLCGCVGFFFWFVYVCFFWFCFSLKESHERPAIFTVNCLEFCEGAFTKVHAVKRFACSSASLNEIRRQGVSRFKFATFQILVTSFPCRNQILNLFLKNILTSDEFDHGQ
jgi:hypothetical protein